jgi:two-component system, NtrC family, response regulator HydG
MIGRSAPMQALFRRIERVARTDATVLIRGERGTGKELVANSLQRLSRRNGAVYVKINCAALHRDLLASELFGHERGAFTGALERRQGLYAAADGGTLFADEVSTLSFEGQAMLLRAIEQGEVRPVGAKLPALVDVRLIAATSKDLERAISEREFLPDLHDRLTEVVLHVPPLRARREDIPLLVEHFVEVHCRRHGVKVRGVSREAWRRLQSHHWPGNVRELAHAVSRAVIFAAGEWIRPEDLQLRDVDTTASPTGSPLSGARAVDLDLTPRQREALELATSHGSVRRGDLVSRFGISGEAARRDLVALVIAGLLRRRRVHGISRYVLADRLADLVLG